MKMYWYTTLPVALAYSSVGKSMQSNEFNFSCTVEALQPTSDMAQKVATARKIKSRQETTSPDQIATVTAKPTISDKHL